jgi:hypothetical protein
VLSNLECGTTAGETVGALNQNEGVQGVWLQTAHLQERSANRRLERSKREIAARITLDDKLDCRRTEMTDTIEEDNGVVVLP